MFPQKDTIGPKMMGLGPSLDTGEYELIWKQSFWRSNLVKDLKVRSFWIRVALHPTGGVLTRERRGRCETRRREGHVKMETEVGVRQPHAQQCQGLLKGKDVLPRS